MQCQSKDLFAKILEITRDFSFRSWAVINGQGTEITELDQVAEVWKKYCEKLYQNDNFDVTNEREALFEEEPGILREEVEWGLKMAKTGKACGPDVITAEVLKATGNSGIQVITNIC